MNDKRCAKCKHFKRVKHLDYATKWIWFNICDLLMNLPDVWGITVTDNERCECFVEAANEQNKIL